MKNPTANSKTQSTTIGSENLDAKSVGSARSWLESLSPEEFAAALSFRDGPFLASFLDLAASSSSTSSSQQLHEDLRKGLKTIDIKDLEKMSVDGKEWEQTLSRQGEALGVSVVEGAASRGFKQEELPKEVHDLPSAEASVEKDDVKPVQKPENLLLLAATATTKSGEESMEENAKEEAEVFRIRGEATKATETSVEASKTPGAKNNKGKGDPAKGDRPAEAKANGTEKANDKMDHAAFSKIAQNVSVVWSTAVESNGDIPFVTIRPAFMNRKEGTGECTRSLDIIIQAFSPSSGFLSPDFLPKEYLNNNNGKSKKGPPSIEKLCLQRVQSLMKSASDNNAPVLLFLILLVRIEVAAFMAFGESKKGSNKGGNNKPKTGAPGRDKLDRQHLEKLMKRLDALEKDSQTLDKSALETIVAPLTGAGYCSLEGNDEPESSSEAELQNLLITPLPALIRLFSNIEPSNRPTFQSWYTAWNATIRNLLEFSNSTPTNTPSTTTQTTPSPSPPPTTQSAPTKADTSTTTTTAKDTESSQNESPAGANTSTPSSSSSSKNKKKANKRKNKRNKRQRKNGGNGNNNNAGDASSPQSNDSNQTNTTITTNAGDASLPKNNNHSNKPEPVVGETPQHGGAAKTGKGSKRGGGGAVTEKTKGGSPNNNNGNQPKSKAKKKKGGVSQPKGSDGGSSTTIDANKPCTADGNKEEKTADDTGAVAPARSSESPASSSADSGKLLESSSDETESESTRHDDEAELEETKPASKSITNNKSDFTVSRVHGVGTVVVAPSTTESSHPSGAEHKLEGAAKGDTTVAEDDNHDEWETVEVKGRGNRKNKAGRGAAQQWLPNCGNNHSQNGSKKSKTQRNRASRNRLKTSRMAKEIVNTIIDNVIEEVGKREQQQQQHQRQQQARAAKKNTAIAAPAAAPSAWRDGSRTLGIAAVGNKKEKTLRDVVIGKKTAATPSNDPPQAVSKADNTKSNNAKSLAAQSSSTRANSKSGANASPQKGAKGQVTSADQNTAPTIPETVSAVSDPRRTAPRQGRDVTRSDSSSTDTDENPKQEERASVPTPDKKMSSPEPPLPTLLNPGNVNSASSSVASSLEAPHASHGHHHASNEVDVGYHLLDVCDRLTRDMHVFMARRASALNTRRRERGALLGALQDSVSSIWAGHSHVELYGSCATLLDLPSSDLDVVVCGLDQMEATMSGSPSISRSASESITPDKMNPELSPQLRHSMPHYVPMHLNAERVMRLAAELEHQPWAVHVKAIPTASVPVVKVLADPSRCPGVVPPNFVEGEEWMMQQQYVSNDDSSGGAPPTPNDLPATEPSQTNSPHYQPDPSHTNSSRYQPDPSQSNSPHYQPDPNSPHFQPAMAPVWRGADVMNGLLQVDITFEGPEHGGIGSTDFSAHVVQNVCDETGLPAESTAFVQVIMVVKELLAQRRLNEPFSGGLSSYALLLLVLAVMCERKVVQEELERVERQRRVVAAGGGNSEMPGTPNVEFLETTVQVEQESPGKGNERPSQSSPVAPDEAQKANPPAAKNPPTVAQKTNAPSVKTQQTNASKVAGDSNGAKPNAGQGSKQANKGTQQAAVQGKQTAKNHLQATGQGKQAAKGTQQATAQGNKQANKNSQQGTKQAPKNATAQGNKQASKNTQQATAQGNKQVNKNTPKATAQGNKQAAKNTPQNAAQGNKQALKSPQHAAAAQGGKQANKSQPQAEKRPQGGNQPRGGNVGRGGKNQPQGSNAGKANPQGVGGKAGGAQPQGGNAGKANPANKGGTQKKTAKSAGNSWASIAMGQNTPNASKGPPPGEKQEAQPSKPASFADAVARNAGDGAKGKAANAVPSAKTNAPAATKQKPTNAHASKGEANKKSDQKAHGPNSRTVEESKSAPQKVAKKSTEVTSPAATEQKREEAVSQSAQVEKERKIEADEKTSKFNNYSSEPVETATQSAFPQGFNDVIEVLCSGETTPGKLLMHFLLFYGQHYDAHATAIDISGKHHRDIDHLSPPYPHLSPYIQRRSAGNIDPVTGMLTVDPIVVYDPLEGAENNNVARRCFLWSNVKWVFAQSYMTLASAAENNTTPPGTPSGAGAKNGAAGANSNGNNKEGADAAEIASWHGPYNPSGKGNLFDPSSPLLELLLSF